MNSKTAKLLRKAAGYNPARTPGKLKWPGVARLYQHPVYERREVTRSDGWLTAKLRHVRTVLRMVHRKDKPVQVLDEKGAPKLAMVPVTKPAVLTPATPKAVYRRLKRLEKKVGLRKLYAYLSGADDAEVSRMAKAVGLHLEAGRPE